MRLTKKNITHYLLDKGFLDIEPFLKGDYMFTQTQSRNCIFKIHQGVDKGIFVKQLVNQDETNRYLLQKDATSHYLIHQSDLFKGTAPYIPEYYGFDPSHNVLVTEYFTNTKNLHEATYQSQELSKGHATKIAEILASFHFDITSKIKENASLQFYSKQLPWIFNIGASKKAGPGSINSSVISEILKHPNLVKEIETIALEWERVSLIHGDIKWMNFIVMPNNEDLKLIDWEIADIGDPLWDVAGVLQSYFSAWILSFDNDKNHHQQIDSLSFLNINTITPVVKCLWDTYSEKQNFDSIDAKEKVLKTLKYMAVRMLQTAFENNISQVTILSNSVRTLQFCEHIFSKPEVLAKQWGLIE